VLLDHVAPHHVAPDADRAADVFDVDAPALDALGLLRALLLLLLLLGICHLLLALPLHLLLLLLPLGFHKRLHVS
jgi:hypothetical protein